MKGIIEFCKREFLVIISGAAALVSCLFVPVTNYMDYVNADTIGLLFCLMIAVAGFRECNLLAAVSRKLLGNSETVYSRKTGTILVFITFFAAMLVTNDVALIAFVPLTVVLLGSCPGTMIYVVTVQTAAANLGSMLTPFGNPQNLFLYDKYDMTPSEFFSTTAPVFAVSALLVLILCAFIKNQPLEAVKRDEVTIRNKSYLALYIVLFILCLLAVFGVLDVIVVFASVCAVAVIIDLRLFAGVDYGLLLTFTFFFIFVGNIQNIEAVRTFVTDIIGGNEMLAAAAASQVISNVPAAFMLSGFTDNGRALVLGTNIGGLGTLVASLASVISFRIYLETDGAKPVKYLGVFTAVNIALLAVIYPFAHFFCA
ncbi:MAG: citrate transporter [Oscillospiraceae bacterium]|nr:citrate transporter [Oscillospiraceae bacterium]